MSVDLTSTLLILKIRPYFVEVSTTLKNVSAVTATTVIGATAVVSATAAEVDLKMSPPKITTLTLTLTSMSMMRS